MDKKDWKELAILLLTISCIAWLSYGICYIVLGIQNISFFWFYLGAGLIELGRQKLSSSRLK